MRHQELSQQVERFLQRKLSPEESKFLVLASQLLKPKKEPLTKAATASAKIA